MLPADSNPFAFPRDTMADRLAKLEKAYRRYPDSPLFARLADLYLNRGKTEEALEVCRRGCQHFPDYATGFLVLSKCYEAQGEVEQARDALDQSLRIDPVNPGGYRRLSGLYQKLGEPTLALKTLEQAAELDPLAEDLGEQVDQLTYQVRLESTRQTSQDEVDVIIKDQNDPVGQMLVGESPEIVAESEEDVEPFAQMQALPEWDDEPDVSSVLEEFKQEPNALFTEGLEGGNSAEEQLVEEGDPPEIGDIAALLGLGDDEGVGTNADVVEGGGVVEEGVSNLGSAGDVAALGMEVMGTSIETADGEDEQGEIEEVDFYSPFDPALMESGPEEAEEVVAADIPSPDEWVRYAPEEEGKEEDEESSIFSPDLLPEDADIFQPFAETAVKEVAVDEALIEPSSPSVGEGSLDRDALNDILSALKIDDPPASISPPVAVEDVHEVSGVDGAQDGLFDSVADVEEPIAEEGVISPEPETVADTPAESPQRPAIDLGPLIEAMVGMGKMSPEVVAGLDVDEANRVSETVEEGEGSSIADLEPLDVVEPVEAFDLSDLEPPSPDVVDTAEKPEVIAVEPLLAEGGISDAEDALEETDIEFDELEEEQAAGVKQTSGRGGGFNMRGDDELLRIFQEIETEGHADNEIAGEVENEPEVEQQKRIATATLAEIYTIQGLTQKAIETYRELLKQEPDNAFIRRKLEDLENGSSRK